jgi:hypothetical protein
MLATVLITNYNYGRFLTAAIESALSQTHTDTEVVVVDDGSTDGSREIIRDFSAQLTSILKDNGGQATGTYTEWERGPAVTAGFEASSGEVVMILDADDILLPHAVETICGIMGDAIVKIQWPLLQIDSFGRPTGAIVPAERLPDGDLRPVAIREGPGGYLAPPTSGNAYSRRVLRTILPIPESFTRDVDAYLNTVTPIFGFVRTVEEPQSCYRFHDANVYASRAGDERSKRSLNLYHHRCVALQRALQSRGVEVDVNDWLDGNPHWEWMSRLDASAEEIKRLVPEGVALILVDEHQWVDDWRPDPIIGGRVVHPFMERNGVYYGPPADDETAIAELKRHPAEDAEHLVFLWPAFWWFEYYTGFAEYIGQRYEPLLQNDRLRIFSLRHE